MPRYLAIGAATMLSAALVVGVSIPASAASRTLVVDSAQLEIQAEQPTPVVTGSPEVGQTLSADIGAWPETAFVTVQWYSEETPIVGATDLTYSPTAADVGARISVWVTVTDGDETTSVRSTQTAPVVLGTLIAPVPTVSGSPKLYGTLIANTGTWTPGTTLAYQWFAGAQPISGAIGSTYVATPAVVGRTLSVAITGTLDGYAPTTMPSSPTAAVAPGVLVAAVPTVTGTAKVGHSLTVSAGKWTSGTKLSYQWFAGTKPIAGATATKYAPTAAVVGKAVSVRVTGKLTGYTSTSKDSRATSVKLGTLVGSTPQIAGTAKVGVKLTANRGSWTKGVSLSYQWYAAGKAVSGAKSSTYTPSAGAVGKTMTVRVTGKLAGYATLTKTSKPTVKVALGKLTAPTPRISGSARLGSTLSAAAGTWTTGTTLRYEWLLNGAPVAGGTSTKLTISSPSWAGKTLSVRVTGTKAGYATVTTRSTSTAAIVIPGRTAPISINSCPSWAPIKGNQGSPEWIYHMPWNQSYGVTNPEECFSTESAARAAGYRAAKR